MKLKKIKRIAAKVIIWAVVGTLSISLASCKPSGVIDLETAPDKTIEQEGVMPNNSDFSTTEHRYAIFENQETWEDAENYCEAQGGHLATIESKKENDQIYTYMISQGYDSAYFGLYLNENWNWVTSESAGFFNWHEGEPNDERSQEGYGMFYWKYEDGTWNDGDFTLGGTVNGGQAFICEWDSIDANNTLKEAGAAHVEKFLTELPSTGVDFDGSYGMQCKDLSNYYISTFGVNPPQGDAIIFKTWELPDRWTRDASPRVGDIFVKNFTSGGVNYGHTGVVTKVNPDLTFDTIEQNRGPNGEYSLTSGYPPTAHYSNEAKSIDGYVFIHPRFE